MFMFMYFMMKNCCDKHSDDGFFFTRAVQVDGSGALLKHLVGTCTLTLMTTVCCEAALQGHTTDIFSVNRVSLSAR